MSSARAQGGGQAQRGGGSNSMLLELVDRILDKGIVIDAWARVSVLSIELLTIEARVVVASVETYLRYAEAIGNTALASMPHPQQAQQPRAAQSGGQQQAQQLGGQGAQAQPALPQPQQANMMPQQMPQQGARPQQMQQPQQMPQQGQPQQMQQPQQQQQQQTQQQPGRA